MSEDFCIKVSIKGLLEVARSGQNVNEHPQRKTDWNFNI
jgi:hypothetical protein